MAERYQVDERVGCVAVVDTAVEAPGPCLHRDSKHVVRYWHGRHVPTWKKALRLAPQHAVWELSRPAVRKARELARRLNEKCSPEVVEGEVRDG